MPSDITEAVKGLTRQIAQQGREPLRKGLVPTGPPNYVRKLSDSKGFNISSFALASVSGDPKLAADEYDLARRFTETAIEKGFKPTNRLNVLVPIDFRAIPAAVADSPAGVEFRQAMAATQAAADPDELGWEARKFKKATGPLSAYQGGIGGDLVAPPAFGPIIDIYRNKAVVLAAGAESVPLPPQGTIQFPRQTDVTAATWQGESTPATESTIGTGTMTMSAKKLTLLSRMSNEFMQFSQQLGNQILQADIATTMALKVDYTALYGTGGATQPLGILRYAGINRYKGAGYGANGNTFAVEDAAAMASQLEARNFELKGWIMHPYLRRAIQNLRVGSGFAADDGKGLFAFQMMREFGAAGPATLQGAPMYVSNQVGRTRAKGTLTAGSCLFGGDFSQVRIGMYGALEVMANPYDTTGFAANETVFRAIMFADVGLAREAGIVTYDHLIVGDDTGLIDTLTPAN